MHFLSYLIFFGDDLGTFLADLGTFLADFGDLVGDLGDFEVKYLGGWTGFTGIKVFSWVIGF